MQLNAQIAEQIRAKTWSILKQDIIIADKSGVVISNNGDLGTSIEGAKEACLTRTFTFSKLANRTLVWFPFIYEGDVLGAFGLTETPEGVTPDMMNLLQGLAEVIVHQKILVNRLQPTIVLKGNFIKQVLEDTSLNSEQVYAQADILQLNLRLPLIAAVINIKNFEETLHSEIGHLKTDQQVLLLGEQIEALNMRLKDILNLPGSVFTYIGQSNFCLLVPTLGASSPTNLSHQLNKQLSQIFELLTAQLKERIITMGVGQYYPELGGLRKSYQEASLALSVGSKVWGIGKFYTIKEVGMFTSLANIAQERKAELAHQLLNPLISDSQLYKTVKTFLECGLNLTTAAGKLHIHRNTLIYRLNKTKKLIKFDPRHFEDALQIKLGLMFYS